MVAIICNLKECQAFEALATAGLVKDKVIDPTLKDEETGELVNQSYSGQIKHHDSRIAFRVEERVEKYLDKEALAKAEELDWTWFCPANIIRKHKTPQYWCAYNYDHSYIRFGVIPVGQQLTSGQPHLLYADSKMELAAKVDAVMGDGYYQKRKGA